MDCRCATSVLDNSIQTFQFTPKNLGPSSAHCSGLWIWFIRCLYDISTYRSHQSQSEMWFKPTSKLFTLPVFSILGNNSTIHQDGQTRTLGVTLHTYFSLSPLVAYQSPNPVNYASSMYLLYPSTSLHFLLPPSSVPATIFSLLPFHSVFVGSGHHKILQTGWLKKTEIYSISRNLHKPQIKVQQGRFLMRILFLAHRYPPSHYVLTWPSPLFLQGHQFYQIRIPCHWPLWTLIIS